jgi:2-polyprenyl-3-methyl-5-hydroxy-6-metoxy-1,4-benzoquinol methylase
MMSVMDDKMQEHNRQYWEGMYEMPLDELPWEIKEAPQELRAYVEANSVPGGKALDAGCGTGNFSVYLARNGYQVVGVDYSEKALAIARENNKQQRLRITYIRADLTELAGALPDERFDLILDYKVAHHLTAENLATYAAQCTAILKDGGRILLICYSDKDIDAAGRSSATGQFGNEMFYRSADEIREFYKGLKEVEHEEVMLGKRLNHAGHKFVFEKAG